jgi:hypothetical protein
MGFVVGADPTHELIYTCEGNWENRVLCRQLNYAGGGVWFARY